MGTSTIFSRRGEKEEGSGHLRLLSHRHRSLVTLVSHTLTDHNLQIELQNWCLVLWASSKWQHERHRCLSSGALPNFTCFSSWILCQHSNQQALQCLLRFTMPTLTLSLDNLWLGLVSTEPTANYSHHFCCVLPSLDTMNEYLLQDKSMSVHANRCKGLSGDCWESRCTSSTLAMP